MNWEFDFYKLVEPIATVISLIYLYLEVREKKALWLFGILSSGIYAIVFFNAHFYADFGLMLYYVAISVYGWAHWGNNTSNVTGLPITRINLKQIATFTLATVLFYFVLLALLLYVPQYIDLSSSAMPYVDSFTVAASITATYMLSQKIIEHWYVWILVNTLSVFMFWIKDLHFTSGLYAIYAVGSIVGYLTWRKNYKKLSLHA